VDAEADSPAEAAFKKFGYIEIGKVPEYSQVASGRKSVAFLYKDLLRNM
jgi:hypothetical protein